jgi:hypothetical protein
LPIDTVNAELARPGTILTNTIYPVPIDSLLFGQLWNLRATALGFTTVRLPDPPTLRVDANGRRSFRVDLGGDVSLMAIANPDGSLRAVAVIGPSGGDGGAVGSTYFGTVFAYAVLTGLFESDRDPLGELGITEVEGSRTGLDRIATIGSYRYRFISTPADGDWLIVTAS